MYHIVGGTRDYLLHIVPRHVRKNRRITAEAAHNTRSFPVHMLGIVVIEEKKKTNKQNC